MLYELVGITRCPKKEFLSEAKAVAKHVGSLVIKNRGVVRTIENWGLRPLPRVWHKNRESHILGAHFYMAFDASPAVQRQIQKSLNEDMRVLRSTIVKLGGQDLPSLRSKQQSTDMF